MEIKPTETLSALQLRGHRRSTKPEQEAWFPTGRMLGSLTASVTGKGDSRDDSGRKWEAPHGPQGREEVIVLSGRGGPSALVTCYSDLHLCNTTDLRKVAQTPSGLI